MKKIHEQDFEPLEIEVNNGTETPDKYTLDFDKDTVKKIAITGFDITQCVKESVDIIAAPLLIKFALEKNHKLSANDSVSKKIWEVIIKNDEDGSVSKDDALARLINLYGQERDKESKTAIPATVSIQKDNSVIVGIDSDKYHLEFNRQVINDMAKNDFDFSQLLNPCTQIIAVPRFISYALQANMKNFSSKLPTTIYNSLYRLTFDDETDYLYVDVLNALCVHYEEVKNSAIKNSKAATGTIKL